MTAPRSLSHFFNTTDPANLDSCDQEQVHFSGKIQPIGALLLIDSESGVVTGVSENIAELLDIDSDAVLGMPLCEIDADLAAQVTHARQDQGMLHCVLDYDLQRNGTLYDFVVHSHAGLQIIEIVPNCNETANQVRAKMRICSSACARIIHAENFEASLQIAVDAVRDITGYSRVKIYRFHEDWSGEVIAESSDGTLPSYLGLCFPATDIPKPVRELYSIVPYRAIGTVEGEPARIVCLPGENSELDLTGSVLRSVSSMHVEYLRNIGVSSSFSNALMHQGKLWGLIAVHNGDVQQIPFDNWSLVQEIATSLMLRHSQQQRTDTADMISRLRQIESLFSAALRRNGNIEEVISRLIPVLREFLGADGFAFQFGVNLHTSGRTPPPDFIRKLIKWAVNRPGGSDQFQTISLHKEWPDAAEHIDTACGVLIQPIVVHRVCQLIWFRGPVTRTVHWAGEPKKELDAEGRLTPRKSFESWTQEHNDQSIPWNVAELQSAREIFTEFLDIMASQLLLKEENENLRSFAYTAAHDLKAPLRGINMALEWMSEDGFDPEAVRETHALALKSSEKLSELAEGLLELVILENQLLKRKPVDLSKVVAEVQDLLAGQIQAEHAQITVGRLPVIESNEQMMQRLFLNLLSNALKYRHPDRSPAIEITSVLFAEDVLEISVADNGLGVDLKFADKIFQPMERAHGNTAVEGSGLGLAICQRIAHKHGGTIALDLERQENGARFVIRIPQHADYLHG